MFSYEHLDCPCPRCDSVDLVAEEDGWVTCLACELETDMDRINEYIAALEVENA